MACSLLGHVDGTFPCPSKYLQDSSSSTKSDSVSSASSSSLRTNPEYTAWHEQDQLILDWFLSSLKQNIFALVITYKTSHSAAWTTLETLFASSSRTRIHHLSIITKGSLSNMADYMKKIISCWFSCSNRKCYLITGSYRSNFKWSWTYIWPFCHLYLH